MGFDVGAAMTFATTDTSGAVAITMAGNGTALTWAADSMTFTTAFEIVGASTLDAVDISGDVVITKAAGTTGAETALDIDVTSSTIDANNYGLDLDLTQGSIIAGAYLSRGNLIGIHSSVAAIGNIDHVWASRGSATLAMTATSETNQFYGGLFSASVSGAETLSVNDGVMGAQFAVTIDAGVTDVDGGSVTTGIVAAGFFFPNAQKDVTLDVYAAYFKCTNYCDYGTAVIVESNNISAGMQVRTKDSAVLPIGLEFYSTSGSITNDIALSGGQFVSGGTDGVPSAAGASAVEYAAGCFKTVITVDATGANDIDLEDKDDGGGVLLYTFPEGHIRILGVVADLEVTSSAGIFQNTFPMALGTTAGADAEATLTGTEADLSASQAISYDGAEDLDGAPISAADQDWDGTSAAITVYLNAAVLAADINTASTVEATGTVTIHWMNLGDY